MESASINIGIKEFRHNFKVSISGGLTISNVRIFKDIIFSDSFRVKNIILDLKEFDYIDSSGIGLLFALCKLQREHNKDVKLDNVNLEIKEILEISGLYGYYKGSDS